MTQTMTVINWKVHCQPLETVAKDSWPESICFSGAVNHTSLFSSGDGVPQKKRILSYSVAIIVNDKIKTTVVSKWNLNKAIC